MLESTPFDIPGGEGAESNPPDGAHDGALLRRLDWADLTARFAAARDLRRELPSARSGGESGTASFGRLAAPHRAVVNGEAKSVNHSALADRKPVAPHGSPPELQDAMAGSTTRFDKKGGRYR